MNRVQQPRSGETALERRQRRDALLAYGHIFAEAHRNYAENDFPSGDETHARKSRRRKIAADETER
jgi:hypothetical protein